MNRLQARKLFLYVALLCYCSFVRAALQMVPQMGHKEKLTTIACAPDAEFCLTAAEDRTVLLHNSRDESIYRIWRVSKIPTKIAFAPNSYFAVCDGAKVIGFSLQSDAPVWSWPAPAGNKILDLCAAPNGSFLVLLAQQKQKSTGIWLLNAKGHPRRVANSKGQWTKLAANNDVVVAGDGGGSLAMWNRENGGARGFWKAHSQAVRALVVSPDGKSFVSGGADCRVVFWDASSRLAERTLTAHLFPIESLAYAADGDSLAVLSGAQVKFWDTKTFDLRREVQMMSGSYTRSEATMIGLTPAGVLAVNDGYFRFWNAIEDEAQKPEKWMPALDESSGEAEELHLTRNGTLITSQGGWVRWSNPPFGRYDSPYPGAAETPEKDEIDIRSHKKITLWNAEGTTRQVVAAEDFPISAPLLSPDQKTFAVIDEESQRGAVRIGDSATGKTRHLLNGLGYNVSGLVFSPNGKWLVISSIQESDTPDYAAGIESEGALHVFRVSDGKRVQVLCGFRGEVWQPVFSPDGRLLASSGQEKQVRLFAFANGQARELFRLPFPDETNGIAFSPDSGTLAVGGNYFGEMRLWDVKTGRQTRAWRAHDASINALKWTANGKVLISSSDDATTAIWNVAASASRGMQERARLSSFAAHLPDNKETMQWLAWTPRGEFTCSPGAEKYLRWRDGDDVQAPLKTPADVPYLRRDDLVIRALRGE